MDLFKNKRIISDFRYDQNNSPSYIWKPIQISNDFDIWLKYYNGDKLDNCVFDVKDLLKLIGIPHAYVYFHDIKDDFYFSYEYGGRVRISRITKDDICYDTIENIDEIVKNIEQQIKEIKKAKKASK